MRTNSSAGPDRFGRGFFRVFWPLVKGTVMDFMTSMLVLLILNK
jgi:hypothetical protein